MKDYYFRKDREKKKYRDSSAPSNNYWKNGQKNYNTRANKIEERGNNNTKDFQEYALTNIKSEWITDSGATSHKTNNKNILKDFEEEMTGSITVADGSSKKSFGKGTVEVRNINGNVKFDMRDVLNVPELDGNLISIGKLDDDEIEVNFINGRCIAFDQDKIILNTLKLKGLYRLKLNTTSDIVYSVKQIYQ